MAITDFCISSLTLIGAGVPNAHVQFKRGLNVIAGPSDTGKTFIVQCIDYMFGGQKAPKPIPESDQYHTVRMCLRKGEYEPEIELERSLRGGDFDLHIAGQNDRKLSAKHKADDSENISQYLLSLAGLVGKKVRTNAQGKTRPVSFRDIAPLVLVDEESIISETSPVLSGQYTGATVEAAVFRLMLTGIDDGSVISVEDPKIARGRLAGKAEMLDLLLDRTKVRVSDLKLPGSVVDWREKLKLVDAAYADAEAALTKEQQAASILEQRRRNAWTQVRKLESRTDVLTELQNRFGLLEQQYRSDLARLESTAEAGLRLGQMAEERCPICGALAEHHEHDMQQRHATPEEIAHSCMIEIGKIRSLLSDLGLTAAQNNDNIRNLLVDGERAKSELQTVSVELQDILKPRIEAALLNFRECQAQRDTYRGALELTGRMEEMQGLMSDLQVSRAQKGPALPSTKVRADETEQFSQEVEVLLRQWHFPNLDRVTFSESAQDIVISGRPRASHGKGVRAIAHAAFNLALLSYCIKQRRPHPGLVLLDSPLVVYREPDTDEGAFSIDVKDSFYRSVTEKFEHSQVIVFENEDPPVDLDLTANVIRFTGASHGRNGFIPPKA